MNLIKTFPNKILSITTNDKNEVFLGDFSGTIYKYSNSSLKVLQKTKFPVSGIKTFKEKVFYCNWNGQVSSFDRTVLLSENICKAIEVSEKNVFVSCGPTIFVLDFDLNIIKRLDIKNNLRLKTNKALCLFNFKKTLYCGLSVPGVLAISLVGGGFEMDEIKSEHSKNIISVSAFEGKNGVEIITGSLDGSVLTGRDVVQTDEEFPPVFVSEKVVCFENRICYGENFKEVFNIPKGKITNCVVCRDDVYVVVDNYSLFLFTNIEKEEVLDDSDEEFIRGLKKGQ